MSPWDAVHFAEIVRAAAIALCVGAIVLFGWLAATGRDKLRSTRPVRLLHIDLPLVSLFKIIGLLAIGVAMAAVTLASHELFVGTKETSACMQCHVMRPYGNDMADPESNLLAARHYRNGWIHEKQCYQCHVDYGFAGSVTAKMDGLRHLLRYTTRTYTEPIGLVHPFNNQNCLHCHAGTPKYVAESMHDAMADVIASNETPCTSCHGDSHPSRERRSPGHADYEALMRAVELPR